VHFFALDVLTMITRYAGEMRLTKALLLRPRRPAHGKGPHRDSIREIPRSMEPAAQVKVRLCVRVTTPPRRRCTEAVEHATYEPRAPPALMSKRRVLGVVLYESVVIALRCRDGARGHRSGSNRRFHPGVVSRASQTISVIWDGYSRRSTRTDVTSRRSAEDIRRYLNRER
jgi:hypothetical protein